MTLEEARKIALVCGTADHGCESCVHGLSVKLNKIFPEFNWQLEPVLIASDGHWFFEHGTVDTLDYDLSTVVQLKETTTP